jgi:hypothetical protein
MLACIHFAVYTEHVSFEEPNEESEETARGGPEPLAAVLRRAFASWAGPSCPTCNMPAVLHGARCDDSDERDAKKLPVDALQRDPLTGSCSPAGDARHASPSFSHEEKR